MDLYEASGLSSSDWHLVKDALLVCRYMGIEEARDMFKRLPAHLKSHQFGVAIQSFLDSRDRMVLDTAAARLTQRSLPEAWTLIERL